MALRLLHSDADLHRAHCPADPVERLIFELLEQLRVETLVPDTMPGMAANLRGASKPGRAPSMNRA
jgi:cobaltochelatase CobT